MKRIIAMAHSYYMLLVLIQLRTTIYSGDIMEIILTDDSKNSNQIYERLKLSEIFNKCHYLRSADLTGSKGGNKTVKAVKSILSPKLLLREAKLMIVNECYDLFLSYVSCRYEEQVIFNVLKKNNPYLKCVLYEEGIVSYYDPRGVFSYQNKDNSNLRYLSMLKKCGKKNGIIENNIVGAWVFNPDLLQYSADFEINRIPAFDVNQHLISKMNMVFDYNAEECSISEPIIFLEDNAVADGHDSDDVEFVEKLVEVYGKDNVAIKLHPRSKNNRFENLGIKTYTKAFPLELFMINENKNKVFVTMNSGAPLSCLVDFNIDNKVIMLYRCSKYPAAVVTNQNFEKHLENIKKFCGEDQLIIPNSSSEFIKVIKERL